MLRQGADARHQMGRVWRASATPGEVYASRHAACVRSADGHAERTIKKPIVWGCLRGAGYINRALGIDHETHRGARWSMAAGRALIDRTHPSSAIAFNAAVAFYPGCRARAARADAYRPYAPTLILIGELDDWTPAAPCKALAEVVSARGDPLAIVVYPDSYHDFDSPGLKPRVRKEVPNGANPGQGVTVPANAEARADATARVRECFGRLFRNSPQVSSPRPSPRVRARATYR